MKVRSRVGFVLPSLDEERPAGVDRQGEEGEEHAEQLDIGHPPSGLHNVNLEWEFEIQGFSAFEWVDVMGKGLKQNEGNSVFFSGRETF